MVELIEQVHGPSPAFLPLIGCHSPPGRAIESSGHLLNERLALADRERRILDLSPERGQMLGQLIAHRGLLRAHGRAAPENEHDQPSKTRSTHPCHG